MHATSDVSSSNVLLLRIPTHLLFNPYSIRTDKKMGFILRRAAESNIVLNPLTTLLFGLLHEQALGSMSEWQPFLKSLPSYQNMVTAQQFTLSELDSVPWAAVLCEEAQLQRENVQAAEQTINALFECATKSEEMKIATQRMSLRRCYLTEDLSWAWSIVSTRACFMDVEAYRRQQQQESTARNNAQHTTQSTSSTATFTSTATHTHTNTNTNMRRLDKPDTNTSALVPWLDLLNHTSESSNKAAKAEWVAGRGFEVTSTVPLQSGEPICLCYGNISNELLLSRYGFVDSSQSDGGARMHPVHGVDRLLKCAELLRRNDCCSSSGNGSTSFCWSCASCSGRMETLGEAGLWPIENAGALTFSTDTMPVSWNLLTIARVLTATNAVASGGKMRSIVNDEPGDSEGSAWALLEMVVAAELLDLVVKVVHVHVVVVVVKEEEDSFVPAAKKKRVEGGGGVEGGDGGGGGNGGDSGKRLQQRQRLLGELRVARQIILMSASSAVAKKCREF